MGMFDKLSGSGFGDFFGNAFTKKNNRSRF